MTDDLEASLKRTLAQIKQDKFGGRDAPIVSVSDDTEISVDGFLCGEILVHITRKNGDKALLHTQPLTGIRTEVELRDAFAEALSKILAAHNSWPR